MSALRCPQCGGDLTPDHNNPGKMLCYNCRKRMDEHKVRQYWGQYAQPRNPRPEFSAQPSQYTQQPVNQTYQQAQPYQQPQQYQQPVEHPAYSQQVYQPQDAYSQQQSPDHTENEQLQFVPAASTFVNPAAYTPPAGFDQLYSDHGIRPISLANPFGSLKNLFTPPQQLKIDTAQSNGIAMGWFSALVKILFYIAAVALALYGIYEIIQPFLPSTNAWMFRLYPVLTVMHIVQGVVYLVFALWVLFVRKQMGDFISGSWKQFIILMLASAVWSILYDLIYSILLGMDFMAIFGFQGIFTLAIDAVLIGLNWVYFKKRDPLFTAVYPRVPTAQYDQPQQPAPPQYDQQPTQPQQPQQPWQQNQPGQQQNNDPNQRNGFYRQDKRK